MIRISGMMTARFLLHIREWQGGGTPEEFDGIGRDSTSSVLDFQVAANRSVETIETFGDHDDFEPPHSSNPVMKSAASNSEVGPSWRYRSRQSEMLASTLV
jgi:hypothetical protein